LFFILDILSQIDYIVNMKWKEKRINAINRKIKNCSNKQAMTENYIDEHWRICNSDASNKEEYKAQCEHEYNDYVNACLE